MLKFLDHCSEVLFVQNLRDLNSFLHKRANESVDPLDRYRVSVNSERLVRSAISLYQQLCPQHPRTIDEILRDVELWSFQSDVYNSNIGVCDEDEPLSLVRQTAHDSFIAIRNEFGQDDSTVVSDIGLGQAPERNGQNNESVFEGQSYRLTIQSKPGHF